MDLKKKLSLDSGLIIVGFGLPLGPAVKGLMAEFLKLVVFVTKSDVWKV